MKHLKLHISVRLWLILSSLSGCLGVFISQPGFASEKQMLVQSPVPTILYKQTLVVYFILLI
jgi:hypothetical protein